MEDNQLVDQISQQRAVVQQKLPNSSGVLVMGILGIVLFGLIGVILSIISLSLASGAQSNYNNNPTLYTESSYKNMRAGKVCAIIGLAVSGLGIFIILAASA